MLQLYARGSAPFATPNVVQSAGRRSLRRSLKQATSPEVPPVQLDSPSFSLAFSSQRSCIRGLKRADWNVAGGQHVKLAAIR